MRDVKKIIIEKAYCPNFGGFYRLYVDRTDVVNFDVIRIDELTDIELAVIFFNDIGIGDITLDDIGFKESALRDSFHRARKEAAYRTNISELFICCDCRPFAGSQRSM